MGQVRDNNPTMKFCSCALLVFLPVIGALAPIDTARIFVNNPIRSHRIRLKSTSDGRGEDNIASVGGPVQREDPFQAASFEKPLMRPLGGGTALIFEMARKCMLDWSSDSATDGKLANPAKPANTRSKVLPRWHPHSGISDVNPSFRTESPVMNNQGFAKTIWRNVRKPNKPSLWRHALRTYDRMAELENRDPDSPASKLRIQRSNIHHEGALLACAKLGLWQRALEIYYHVLEIQQQQESQQEQLQQKYNRQQSAGQQTVALSAGATSARASTRNRRRVYVTDNMILSLVRACVRASRDKRSSSTNLIGTNVDASRSNGFGEEDGPNALRRDQQQRDVMLRRIPLDSAMEILTTMPDTHNIPIVARHVNPVAAAYQSLGFLQDAQNVLQVHLSNRTAGEEPEDGVDILNVYDFCSKDKGSYSLLVQCAVASGDWASAVEALQDMTEAGLYPTSRHCNSWTEISERQSQPRAVGGWKKKRDDYWLESVR